MNILKKFTNIGVYAEQPASIQEKIRLSNSVILLGLVFMVPGIFLGSFMYPPAIYPTMLTYYLAGILCYVITLGLNIVRLSDISRLLLSVYLSVSTAVLYIAFQPANEPPIAGMFAICLITGIIPWMFYDLQEWGKLAFSQAVQLASLCTAYWGSSLIELPLDKSFVNDSAQNIQYVFSGFFVLNICLYIVKKSHFQTQKNNSALISEMQDQQSQLQEKETRLNAYISEVEESQRINQQRQWASDGLAMFAEILRRDSGDSAKLYDTLICQIVKYVHANQGGLFLVQHENQESFIELAACYAYERKKYQKKRIEIGEGMVGQAAQEVDTLYFTDIPQDYIHITSGLGKANPNCLLIIPLKVSEQVEGVLELASFEEMPAYKIEFLEKLGESIAATVATNRINQRTKQLLDASQWQTEALRAQEEEMRQNMEELAATQEEMERKTREMEEVYAQSREREKELTISLKMLEATRAEMEEKQQAIQTLLYEAQRNEEQLRQQEETLRRTLAQVQAAQEELKIKNEEIGKTKEDEKARATAQIESQKKVMQKVLDKQKVKETELQLKINSLESEVAEFRKNFL